MFILSPLISRWNPIRSFLVLYTNLLFVLDFAAHSNHLQLLHPLLFSNRYSQLKPLVSEPLSAIEDYSGLVLNEEHYFQAISEKQRYMR